MYAAICFWFLGIYRKLSPNIIDKNNFRSIVVKYNKILQNNSQLDRKK